MSKTRILDDLDTLIALIETCCSAISKEDEHKEVSETLFFVAIPMIEGIQKKIKKDMEQEEE